MSARGVSSFAGALSCALLVACTDDFDALFVNAPSDAGGDVSADAGDGARDASDGAATSATTCVSGSADCTCGAGSTCNASCDVDGECSATAKQNSKLVYECREHVDVCRVACEAADCDVRCDAEGACSLACGDDAKCVLRCTGRPTSCNLTCGEGTRRDCGSGVFTCGTCP